MTGCNSNNLENSIQTYSWN